MSSDTEHTDADGERDPESEGGPSKPARTGRSRSSAERAERRKRRRKAAEAERASEKVARPSPSSREPEAEEDEAELEASPPKAALPPEEEPQLLPVGNPLQLVRGPLAIAVGALVAFGLMATPSQFRFGVPVAALAILVATFGVLDLAGTFDDPEDRVAGKVTLSELARPLGLFLGGSFALWAVICLAVDGRFGTRFPVVTAGILVPACFLAVVVGIYQIAETFGVWSSHDGGDPQTPGPAGGDERPLLRRHGFWLIVLTTVLYLPLLGSHSLSDPWETHYGEVSREILARNDWISTWWAQDGWFWSKPVLDFWIQALSMATFGVRYKADSMLSAVSEGRIPWPEWAMRLPVFLLTVVAVYLLYKAIAKIFNRRAGLLGGVVLLTMPQWFILSHQTMTDMPFVAPMASAMALFLLGAYESTEDEVKVYELSLGPVSLRFSALHLVLGAIVASSLPQILYLVSRNLLLEHFGLHPQLDTFSAGSPGNCGLPGNENCHLAQPVVRGLHPALQALIWAQALALVVYLNWGERRRQRLYYLGGWYFAALSTMAKGPAGFLLPALCLVSFALVTRTYRDRVPGETPLDVRYWRWRALSRLELTSGALILLAVALPWFVAMYVRHGQPFTDRLIFHDMFKRAFTHIHDTNEGDDTSFRFYVWQLGYATFPWIGLLPAGLLYWLRRRDEEDRSSDASLFLVTWFIFAFALFSFMLTKFHHYIFPALPPAAMLTGVLLDGMLERWKERRAGADEAPSWSDIALYGAGLVAGLVVAAWGGTRFFSYVNGVAGVTRMALYVGAAAFLGGIGILVGTVVVLGRAVMEPAEEPGDPAAVDDGGLAPPKPPAPYREDADALAAGTSKHRAGDEAGAFRRRYERVLLGGAGLAGAFLVLAVGRDLSANMEGWNSQIRLWHLVTYNYRRPWPTSLDFTPTLAAFTVIAAALLVALLAAPVRRHVVAGLLALGVVWGAWGLGVYLMQVAPHWGQRETTIAYYQHAREAPGPLIAYQMNWKGENFYTGNHVPAFVSSGKKFQDYILDEKKKGAKTFYFVTEHGRAGTLSNEIGATKEFTKLTPPELDNKFVLVRASFD